MPHEEMGSRQAVSILSVAAQKELADMTGVHVEGFLIGPEGPKVRVGGRWSPPLSGVVSFIENV